MKLARYSWRKLQTKLLSFCYEANIMDVKFIFAILAFSYTHSHGRSSRMKRARSQTNPPRFAVALTSHPATPFKIMNLFIHSFWDDIEFNWIPKWVYSNANNFRYANDLYYFGHNSNCLLPLRTKTHTHARCLLSVCYQCVCTLYLTACLHFLSHLNINENL